MRIGLVGTSTTKLAGAAPARELYQGRVFTLACQVAQQACEHWYVLSAQHGLVAPETVIAPDQVTLKGLRATGRRAWAQNVLRALADDNTPAAHWLILAPELYHEYLKPGLQGSISLLMTLRGSELLKYFAVLRDTCPTPAAPWPTYAESHACAWSAPPQLNALTAAYQIVLAAFQREPRPLTYLSRQVHQFSEYRLVNLLHGLAYRGRVLQTPQGWQLA